jgi:hypothetical protein
MSPGAGSHTLLFGAIAYNNDGLVRPGAFAFLFSPSRPPRSITLYLTISRSLSLSLSLSLARSWALEAAPKLPRALYRDRAKALAPFLRLCFLASGDPDSGFALPRILRDDQMREHGVSERESWDDFFRAPRIKSECARVCRVFVHVR